MADPGTGSEFTSDELDRIEDALERLGDPDGADGLEALPAHLRARLGEYEAVLALAREALPLEDVPPGLLDGVLAEAARAPAPAPTAAPGPGFWERLRRSFVLPGVALAGTAALLLWVVSPQADQPADDLLASEMAPAPSAAAPEAPRSEAPAAKQEAAPTDMAEAPAEREPEMKKDSPAPDAAAPASLPGSMPMEADKPRAAGPAKTRKVAAEPPPPLPGLDVAEGQRLDADKDTVRDNLERGDGAREKGSCKAAAKEYEQVARSNGPAAERARALAGLGLCAEASGDASAAARYFEAARALDPAIGGYIQRELGGEASVKKAKAKPAAADGL